MQFTQAYEQLDDRFYEPIAPKPVKAPDLVLWNAALAARLGIDRSPDDDATYLAQVFSGNRPAPGAKPVALAYAGHQFGHFVPQLGDGRAHLLGELTDLDGTAQEIQLKGSGPTRFSRGGDGRCGLGPAVREYLMSEALHALGVPTTRSLAVVTTGETVVRQEPQPGAVVTRVAASHLRVGTLQYFAARGQVDAVKTLCDFAIDRHYPDLEDTGPDRYLAFLDAVMGRQVRLVTEWLRIGFIHGVMNTDNTALSGQTIDYGPCAMMNAYDPATVFSSIDHQGRYAFGNQPRIAQWNMARLAECLVPLVDEDPDAAVERLNPVLEGFVDRIRDAWLAMMGRKLGLSDSRPADEALINDLLGILRDRELDYTVSFQKLAEALDDGPEDLDDALQPWLPTWQERVREQAGGEARALEIMADANPVVIPRNHHVEAVIADCVESCDGACVEPFLTVLRSPFQRGPHTSRYEDPPPGGDGDYMTFCGT